MNNKDWPAGVQSKHALKRLLFKLGIKTARDNDMTTWRRVGNMVNLTYTYKQTTK